MKKCPKCNKTYDDTWGICINCSVKLVEDGDRLSRLEEEARQILKEIAEIRASKTPAKEATSPAKPAVAAMPHAIAPVSPAKENTEIQIGKYILSKIGTISIVAGVAFLIAYTFKYLMPIHKILIGYVISCAMLYFGSKVEKREKFKWYGRGLIGGGWVLAYFTTFAMHHIQATRIIQNQLIDLILVAGVVSLMIVHLFKYRSQSILALTLFLGYLTAGISNVNYFTFIYITLLAIVAVVMAYKMNWHGVAFFSLVGTYVTHLVWIKPQIYLGKSAPPVLPSEFWLTIGFLTSYWVIYNIIPFIMKTENENDKNLIRAFILINSFFFGLLGFLEVQIYNPLWRFNFAIFSGIAVAVLAVLSKYLNKEDCVVTPYIVTSIAFVTSSLPFKVNKNLVNLIWLAEIPILTYAGMKLIKGLYRIASWTLALIMSIKMLMLLYVSTTMVIFMGRDLSTRLIVLICGAICFYLTRYIYFYQKELPSKWKEERAASHMYTLGGTAVLLLV